MRKALYESGLACAEIALQTDHVTSLKNAAQPHTNPARLIGTAAEEIQGMCIQNGHRGDYTVTEGVRVRRTTWVDLHHQADETHRFELSH